MKTQLFTKCTTYSAKSKLIFLISFWTMGICLGVHCSFCSDIPEIHCVSLQRVSILSRLVTLCVPVLISYAVIYFFDFRYIFPLALYKAFAYAFCAANLRIAYCSAGWLVSGIALFVDTIGSLLIWVIWISSLYKGKLAGKSMVLLTSILICLGFIDFFAISPFMESLLNY